ncbi:MAG TPA: ABC transporter ATP-binding protein [Patescibacteria group bacterium]|nr:ABC transporter ATP-binding protein [Patescibacteria group bacterium]
MKSRIEKSINYQTLRIFWQFTKQHPVLFWWGTLGAMIGTFFSDITPPIAVALAFGKIQHLAQAHQPLALASLLPYVWLYLISKLISLICWRTEAWCTWRYSILVQQQIAEHLFNKLQNMGTNFHANRFGGALVSQVTKFISAYDRFIADFTWNIVTSVTAFVASLVVFSFTSPPYALAFSLISLTYFTIIYRRVKRLAPFNRALASSESERTAKLADMVTNVSTVHSFAQEQAEKQLFHHQASATSQTHFKMMRGQMKNELIGHVATDVLDITAFIGGLAAITLLHASISTLYLIVTYTFSLTVRLWQAMFVMRSLNRTFGDAADMTAILQLEPEIQDSPNPEQVRIHRGRIEFKDVTFAYEEDKSRNLFENLSLRIKPGEKVGLIGHSGGGKTTITKLLLRLMDVKAGHILVDGQDIRDISQHDLRLHIAYVPQEPMLFHRSIMENIRYGQLDASDEAVYEVARMAHAHEFVSELSHGYQTLVGERGVKLSGGQRQRVAIARAMVKNAPILLLDEATSALDSESEGLIQDALWKLMQGRTAIVIAHRLSTIQKMDRIIVLDKGKVVEEGTHKELIRQKGVYANLWNRQSGGFIED